MIEITKLSESDVGREVRYETIGKVEYGRITSWNEKFIFVRYHSARSGDGVWRARTGTTSEATDPEDLEFDRIRAN